MTITILRGILEIWLLDHLLLLDACLAFRLMAKKTCDVFKVRLSSLWKLRSGGIGLQKSEACS